MSRFKGHSVARDPRPSVPPLTPRPIPQPPPVSPAVPAPLPAAAGGNYEVELGNPIRRATFALALVFIFIRFSLIHEIAALVYGIRAYLPLVFGLPVLIGLVMSGALRNGLRFRSTYYWLAHAGWLAVATVFSSWRGGSFDTIQNYYKVEFPMVFVLGCLAVSWGEIRLILYSICAGGLINEFSPKLIASADAAGRQLGGVVTIGNSNDFAAHLLMLLPIIGVMAIDGKVPKFFRLALAGMLGFGVYLVGNTGSRGGLIALLVTVAMLVLRVPGKYKIVFGLLASLSLAVLVLTMRADVLARYATVFSDTPADASDPNSEAQASAQERKYLMGRAVDFTLQHPFSGVGPGQFSASEGFSARQLGRRGAFAVPHNTFLQVSSEAGIPALIFFLGAIFSAYGALSATLKQAREAGNAEIARVALAVMLSMVAFGTAAFFLSLAYRLYFLALSGLAIAVARVAGHELSCTAPAPAFRTGLSPR